MSEMSTPSSTHSGRGGSSITASAYQIELRISSAFGNGQRDVVVLFMSAESPDFIEHSRYDALCRQMPMAPQLVDQPLFSEFFVRVVERFGYSIGIDCQDIPTAEGSFLDPAIPVVEQAQYRARGLQAVQSVVAAEEKRRKVAAVCIS